jgi:hypothetical protein
LCRKPAFAAAPAPLANRSPAHVSLGVAMALPLLLAGGEVLAQAQNWEIAPRVLGGYRYNDNYRLDLPGGEIDVSGAEADAAVAFRNVDPRTKIEVTPRIIATYFPDQKEEDSTDYFLDAGVHDATQRRRMGITGRYSHEDVVRSETPAGDIGGDLGDPQSVDGGRTFQRNRRDLFRIAPYFEYDMTQRYRLEAQAHYLEANFDEQNAGSQQDFSDYGISGGLGFLLSPRSSITMRALASKYETTFETDSYGGELEWATDYSETSRLYVRAGAQQTEPENGPSDTNWIAGIGGRWTSQRNVFFVDLTRQITPVSAGTVVERHQLRLRLDHDISPRMAVLLAARASRDEELEGIGDYPTREYATAEAGLEWRVQRYLSFTATYNYRWQEYADEPSDASANGFLIGIVYEPKRLD